MSLQIGDNLYLGMFDERNMCLYREITRKDKESGEEVAVKDYLGYYPNLEYALKHILQKKLMYSKLTAGMEQVLKDIEEYKVLAKKINKESWRIYED